MRFAIIIPAYNSESTVRETIFSAISQSVEDLEVIVVDDGSTDATLTRTQEIRDPRLRVLSQANTGVMAARRAGFKACSTDAVCFLDADDRLRPDALARYEKVLESRPEIGVVYGDCVFMDVDGRTYGSRRGALLNPNPSGSILHRLLTRNFLSTLGQTCIRSECLANASALSMNIRRAIDWVLYCEIATTFEFAYLGHGPVIEYRITRNSMARSFANAGEHATDIDEILPAIHAIYALPGVTDSFTPEDLIHLRRTTEGSAYAWKGQELLRARQWRAARTCFIAAIQHSPFDLRDLLCLGLTYLRAFPPGTRRHIGLP